jgi:hypothetical protein
MTVQTSVEYRYFLTDLLTNTVISEVPFKNVSYERANKRAGAFSGSIPFVPVTKGLDLYEATMPGRTGLYIMRNNVCVWGGIIWSRSYDVLTKELSVDGAEFVSYLYHRNIWQTLVYGSEYIGVSNYSVSSGVATVTTEIPHGFSIGQAVRISTVNPIVNGDQFITEIPATNQFRFTTTSGNGSGTSTSGACRLLADTYDVARDLVYRVATDLGGINFSNEVIKPGISYNLPVVAKQRSGNIVTLTFNKEHDVIAGQEITVIEVGSELDGSHFVLDTPTTTTLRYELNGPDVQRTTLPGTKTLNVLSKAFTAGFALITLDAAHGASVNQEVELDGIDGFFTGVLDSTLQGRFRIADITGPASFTVYTGSILDQSAVAVAGGTASFGARVVYEDSGSYISNSDIGIGYEELDKSGYYRDTLVLRGFQQRTVGEILEEYSNSVIGPFDYRIDCDYDFDTATFSRSFRLFPIKSVDINTLLTDENLAKDLGADQIVFEYPGNIARFTVDESAEDAATRFFVVGNIEDLNDEASQPYSGAAERNLLGGRKGRAWPLLDQVEQLDTVENEQELWEYASDYLYESLPPIGTYNIAVNGSLAPLVGSYYPGDWCSLIIDDEFVRQRLANDQEPSDEILIRKISSYTVSVPDTPSFPETVDLTLVTDWQVLNNG